MAGPLDLKTMLQNLVNKGTGLDALQTQNTSRVDTLRKELEPVKRDSLNETLGLLPGLLVGLANNKDGKGGADTKELQGAFRTGQEKNAATREAENALKTIEFGKALDLTDDLLLKGISNKQSDRELAIKELGDIEAARAKAATDLTTAQNKLISDNILTLKDLNDMSTGTAATIKDIKGRYVADNTFLAIESAAGLGTPVDIIAAIRGDEGTTAEIRKELKKDHPQLPKESDAEFNARIEADIEKQMVQREVDAQNLYDNIIFASDIGKKRQDMGRSLIETSNARIQEEVAAQVKPTVELDESGRVIPPGDPQDAASRASDVQVIRDMQAAGNVSPEQQIELEKYIEYWNIQPYELQ